MFCPYCGREIAEDHAFCQYCGGKVEEAGPAASGGRIKTPWEDRDAVGILNGLFRTVRESLFRPSAFFGRMPVTGGLADPLLFAMIVGMVGLMFFYLWDILLHDSFQNFMTPELRAAAGRNVLRSKDAPFAALMTPFLLLIWLFIAAGMLHLFLLMVRGAKAGFEATFRVVSYCVSPFLFLAIPVCGMPITAVWVMSLAIIGLKEAHEISGGKASFAVLFPFLFCCGLIVIAIALFMGAVAASFGTMMNFYR
jgi:hypothetical protein